MGRLGYLSRGLKSSNISYLPQQGDENMRLIYFVKYKGYTITASLELERRNTDVRNHFCDVEKIRVLAVPVSSVKEMLVLEYIPDLLRSISSMQWIFPVC